ncbi:putative histone acetyltransferase type B catalytic subunit [Cercophora samala]|uniref:Histone acetyltransferase type B catalytic subunit n=1 Tax=Cercophora samala TaxID=330535 RepID=A0AA39ZET5_9PEZI|nr:putative histone acetyltransferase type B catalytic subunit [Cercophora samala]
MADDDAWTASANEAFVISLVAPGPNGKESKFHPRFTYPIFGEEEEIFGYQDLQINLRYNATDMRPNLQVKFSKQFPAIEDAEPLDIKEVLSEFLPPVAFQTLKEWKTQLAKPRDDWTPPGELLTSFTNKAGHFEVWKGTLSDPAVQQLVKRIQILVPLFIEGGTAINLDDKDAHHWTIFFLYQKNTSPTSPTSKPTYIFAGYSTVYRFFFLQLPPTPSPSEEATPSPSPSHPDPIINQDFQLGSSTFDITTLPCRSRISQFLIIPPFQHLSLGSRLYHAIYQTYLSHPPTKEITVEDPNEAFDDMRDLNDLRHLRTLPSFQALHINTSTPIPKSGPVPKNIIDEAAAEKVRRAAKMTRRQFYRVLEMQLMSRLGEAVRPGIVLDDENEKDKGGKGKGRVTSTAQEKKEYALWKLMLKKRLYVHNRDALGQLELGERVEKLGEVVKGVEFDYARLLVKVEDQELMEREEEQEKNGANGANGKGKKRKAMGEVGGDDNQDGESLASAARKKIKVVVDEGEEEE